MMMEEYAIEGSRVRQMSVPTYTCTFGSHLHCIQPTLFLSHTKPTPINQHQPTNSTFSHKKISTSRQRRPTKHSHCAHAIKPPRHSRFTQLSRISIYTLPFQHSLPSDCSATYRGYNCHLHASSSKEHDPISNAFLLQSFYAPDYSVSGRGDRKFPSFPRFLGISFPLLVPIDQRPPLLLASPI